MSEMERIPLSNVRYFSFISGLWTGKKPPFRSTAVLRSTNFRGDGLLAYDDIAILDAEERQLEARQLQPGDIVIERSGGGPKQPVGRVALFDPPDKRQYATSNFTAALRVVDKNAFDPEYVCLFLHALYLSGATETLQRATTGIRNLDWSEYQSFAIPLLPIREQKVIADTLRRSREGVLIEDNQLASLAKLKHATMRTLFARGLRDEAQKETEIGPVPESWDVIPLGALGRIGNGSTPKRGIGEYWEGGDFPWLTSAKVYDRNITAAEQYVTATALRECHLPIIEPGAILVAITGQGKTLGHCAVLGMRATVNQHVAYVATDIDRAHPSFIRGYLETQYDYFRQVGVGGGSTKGALTCAFLRTLPVPLPPTLDEQREVVAVLDAIDRKIELHHQKRAAFDALFKALMNKLVGGELHSSDLDLVPPGLSAFAEVAA